MEAAQERIQGAVDAVSKWSARWKLQLSAEKCECAFFSTNSHEAKWRPSITIEGRPLKYNPTPTFLGIKYDRQLTFGGHVEEVTKKVKRRSQAIRKLGNTDWGYEKEVLRGTYIAVGRSVIEYAAPAWIPWTSKTNLENLEAAQRYAARAVTGQLKTTPAVAVLIESDLPSIKTRSMQLAISAFDKARRQPQTWSVYQRGGHKN